MTIQRFRDDRLQQYSYLVIDHGQAVIIDPARHVAPYLEFLMDEEAELTAIVLTHRPTTYASGWRELRDRTDATLYAAGEYRFHGPGRFVRAERATLIPFGEGCHLQCQPTPGFTADSICLLARAADGDVEGIFTGAALVNDGCGYPLPRPDDKNPLHGPKTYARELYDSAHKIIKGFPDKVPVYSGLDGKHHFVKADGEHHVRFSLAEEKTENPLFLEGDGDRFATFLTEDLPFVPTYYGHCRQRNTEGFPEYATALHPFTNIAPAPAPLPPGEEVLIIDTRNATDFHAGHAANAVNIQAEGPFALWLGSIVRPGEPVALTADSAETAAAVGDAVAKVGYDEQVRQVTLWTGGLGEVSDPPVDLDDLRADSTRYTIIDVRPPWLAKWDTRFSGALNVPLETVRDNWRSVPRDRPIVVHCAGGFHSAIGASLLRRVLPDDLPVYDLGAAIKDFKPA